VIVDMFLFELQIGLVVAIDLVFGDPRFLPHPVRFIGLICTGSERFFRKLSVPDQVAGILSFMAVLCVTLGITALLLFLINLYSSVVASLVAVYLLYTSIAARDLITHSRSVYVALQDSTDIAKAQKAVAMIVGRDTATLDRQGVIRACVETVAENMVDGVTAPLFYAVLFSLLAPLTGVDPIFLATIGALAYKAVNTMDSMFGYKNERYLHFGRMAAKVDDYVNYIPARLSGLILIPTALVLGLDWRNSCRVFMRDRLAHASPNAAHPEAAMAGALNIELGGTSVYFGKEMIKPTIGDNNRAVTEKDILLSNRMMLLGSYIFLILLLAGRYSVTEFLL